MPPGRRRSRSCTPPRSGCSWHEMRIKFTISRPGSSGNLFLDDVVVRVVTCVPIPSELIHCSAIVFCSTRTSVGSADGHLVSGRRDTHQLLLLSCAHDDARGYPIGFGVLVLDL